MPLTLSSLPNPGQKQRRRVGRGSGSGRGTTASRGTKGQRSRTGGRRGLKRRGLKQFMMQIPKMRGFRSPNRKPCAVTIERLEKSVQPNAAVTMQSLKDQRIVPRTAKKIKIIGNGKLTKSISVFAHRFSLSAKKSIIDAGGTIHHVE